jgi:hypothetical protein
MLTVTNASMKHLDHELVSQPRCEPRTSRNQILYCLCEFAYEKEHTFLWNVMSDIVIPTFRKNFPTPSSVFRSCQQQANRLICPMSSVTKIISANIVLLLGNKQTHVTRLLCHAIQVLFGSTLLTLFPYGSCNTVT